MSKNRNHYNWQNWISQTNYKKKDKILLKEMDQQWVDKITNAIRTASTKKQPNFARYFGETNRIIIDYDNSKMTKLGILFGIVHKLIRNQVRNKSIEFQKKIYKKYVNFDYEYDFTTNRGNAPREVSKQLEELLPDNLRSDYGGLETLHAYDFSFNIEKKTVQQKGRAAGGAEQITELTLYIPEINYVQSEPWPEKTPNDVKLAAGTRRKITNVRKSFGEVLNLSPNKSLFKWWQENQYKFAQDLDVVEGAKNYFDGRVDGVQEKSLDELEESFNRFNENTESDLAVIVSRAPIDVLRMSDFLETGLDSCHVPPATPDSSYTGEYFYCALAEARNQGAIAYMVNRSDLEGVDLNQEEIFVDKSRGIEGILPVARVRLRRIVDNLTGVDFMVPEQRVYGRRKFTSFLETVTKWVAKETAEKILINDPTADEIESKYYVPDGSELTLLGGHYTDSGTYQLAKDLVDVLTKATDLLSVSDEEKEQILSMIKDNRIRDVEYAGEEDEFEAEDPCERLQTDITNLIDEVNHGSEYSWTANVECDGMNNYEVSPMVQIDVSFDLTDEDYFEGKKIDKQGISELLNIYKSSDAQYEFLEKVTNSVNLLFNKVYLDFDPTNINVNVKLFSSTTIEVSTIIENSFSNYHETEYYVTTGNKMLERRYEGGDIVRILISALEEFGYITDAELATEDTQGLMNNFIKSLVAEKNHFQYQKYLSTEGSKYVFKLKDNPYNRDDNYAENSITIAKIPVTTRAALVGLENVMYRLGFKAKEIEEDIIDAIMNLNFGSDPFARNKQPLMFDPDTQLGKPQAQLDLMRTRSLPAVPLTDKGIKIGIFLPNEEMNLMKHNLRDTAAVEPGNVTNAPIKLMFMVTIDTEMENQQEIVNAMNFIDSVGSQENYKKVIDAISKVVNEQIKDTIQINKDVYLGVKDLITDPSKPIADKTLTPQTSSNDVAKSPLFSQNRQQVSEETTKKKLVINERFKRLIRNMNK